MDLAKLCKPKQKGYYDTEHFKNQVKINDLKEKLFLQSQRIQIAKMEKQLNPSYGNGIVGIVGTKLLDGFFGAGMAANQMYGKKQRRKK